MTMNCDNDSVLGVIMPVENKMLPILNLILILTKTHPLFAKNTAAVFLLVVKVAAPRIVYDDSTNEHRTSILCSWNEYQ